jgi:hypothetical protein
VKPSFSKRRVAAAALVILLVLFMARPGGARLKARITNAISRSVARPTDIGSVQIRFLPRPGFDLENLVIYEDPAFGSEPMLRAPEVIAVVRLTSLLRGRLDISRLELTEPSLNLVRREDGRWNWNSLLERTARTPLAPTAKSKSEARSGFPYIEATSGRINFKNGTEKKPYALLNADFDVWQESENSWGVRLTAEPLRTDMNLSDTGLLRMSGTWQRATSLHETPMQLTMEWQHAQLGQLTKLVTGNDKGWRGDVQVEAKVNGTPGALHITANASIGDFHRYDISSSDGPRLAARCEGNYSVSDDLVREIFCTAPVGDGMVTLKGDAGLPESHDVDLALDVENVPVSAMAQVARRAKKDLPQDLSATGSMQGVFEMKEHGPVSGGAAFKGRGEFTSVRLQSAANRGELASTNVPFMVQQDNPRVRARGAMQVRAAADMDDADAILPDEVRIEYGPFSVGLGRPIPAQVRGWVGRSGYLMAVRGDAEVSHVLRMASLVGLQAVKANVEGAAQMDLRIAGMWSENGSGTQSDFLLPRVTGNAQLHNVHPSIAGLNQPIEITSAKLHLGKNKARIADLSAQAAGAHWGGWIELPRGCGTPGACVAQFNLSTDEIRASALHMWLSSHANQRRWYEMLSREEPETPAFVRNLRAAGKVTLERLLIHDVVAQHVSASIEMGRGTMNISNLRADLLGGKHLGDWRADFTGVASIFSGTGTLTGISLEQMSTAMHDPWITGMGAGAYQFKVSSTVSTSWWQAVEGSLRFDLRDGMMPHLSLASDAGPLRFAQWQGRAGLHDGKIDIEKGELVSSSGAYEVSGIASLSRTLDFKLVTDTETKAAGAGSLIYSITGTVAEPQVTLTPRDETRADLKP